MRLPGRAHTPLTADTETRAGPSKGEPAYATYSEARWLLWFMSVTNALAEMTGAKKLLIRSIAAAFCSGFRRAPGATAVGPYSHGVAANGFVYLSGQTPIDAATGRLVAGGIEVQTRQCFRNLEAVLQAAGLAFDDVTKCNVFLTDMDDFAAMNDVYAGRFSEPYPARTTIGVAALPLGARIEIETIAVARRLGAENDR